MEDSMQEYISLCDKLYLLYKKLNYGLHHFKSNGRDLSTWNSYAKIIAEFAATYRNQSLISKELELPALVEFNFKGPGFYLHEGIFYGNVESAKSYAAKVYQKGIDTFKNLENYARYRYILYCLEKEQRPFVEVPQGIKDIYSAAPTETVKAPGEASRTESPVLSTNFNPMEVFSRSKKM